MTKLKQMRKQRDISQEQLAQGIGVTQAAISHWEAGNYNPSLENLIAIAKFLNCPIDDLIDRKEER